VANYALIIGVGEYMYADAGWNLEGAVNDAVAFKTWAVEHGGVETVDLLLSPWPDEIDDVPKQAADRRSIVEAIQRLKTSGGKDHDRLYVYYAGHGVSAAGVTAGGVQEPVIVPADVKTLRTDTALLIGFSQIIPLLADVEPREQFFFIDACRDFALEQDYQAGIGGNVGIWSPANTTPGARSAQYVLYATSPGLPAFEKKRVGRGVYGGVLLEGLRGSPAATVPSPSNASYEVRWESLVKYVQDEVSSRLSSTPSADGQTYVQVPQPYKLGGTNPSIVSLTLDQVGKVSLRVRVKPSAARTGCKVDVLHFLPGGIPFAMGTVGPPAKATQMLEIPPGEYALEATADSFAPVSRPLPLFRNLVEDIDFEPSEQAASGPADAEDEEGVAAVTGELVASPGDSTARVVVLDAARDVVADSANGVRIDVDPGIYKVQLILPEGTADEQTVMVRAGQTEFAEFNLDGPQLGESQLEMLKARGIEPSEAGTLHPSENLGEIANAKLASLLAYAAFAVTGNQPGFERLREFGVDPAQTVPPDRGSLLLLFGASGGEGTSERVAESGAVVRDATGVIVDEGPFVPLSGFPAAGQRSVELPAGTLTAELAVPGVGATRYALACLPSRRTVLVVVDEGGGRFDVQQYMIPIHDTAGLPEFLLQSPQHIRLIESAQRYFAANQPLPTEDVEVLLAGKWVDPLLGALAGYSLVASGQPERYADVAMGNMITHFPELPDSHVLAGLCDPQRASEHFANAVAAGLPVFADGLRVLYQWCQESGSLPPILAEPGRQLVPGSPWTAYLASRPALPLTDGTFSNVPAGWGLLSGLAAAVAPVAASVGRVETTGGSPWSGTCFVVGDGLILTASFVVEHCIEKKARGWALTNGAAVKIDFSDAGDSAAADEYPVVGVIGLDEPSWLCILRVQPSAGGKAVPPPLRLAATLPDPLPGRLVYLVDYPATDDQRGWVPGDAVLDERPGIKRLHPGYALAFDGSDKKKPVVRHDCSTMPGSAGAPLVDFETGLVLGLHGALHADGGQFSGEAVALSALPNHPLVKKAGITFE
jgi:hypothetical protein